MNGNIILIKAKTVSEISRDLGQVFFASMFLGPLLVNGNINWIVVLFGLSLSIICWYWSLLIAIE